MSILMCAHMARVLVILDNKAHICCFKVILHIPGVDSDEQYQFCYA